MQTPISPTYVYRVAFVAAIGGFLFGFDLGMIGAANVYLKDQFQLTDAQLGLATGSAVLGCMLGPFLGAWLCDVIGRKTTMIVASFLLAVSAVFTVEHVLNYITGIINTDSKSHWYCYKVQEINLDPEKRYDHNKDAHGKTEIKDHHREKPQAPVEQQKNKEYCTECKSNTAGCVLYHHLCQFSGDRYYTCHIVFPVAQRSVGYHLNPVNQFNLLNLYRQIN